jgi:hypothetical protein
MAEPAGISVFTPPRQPATNPSPAAPTRHDAAVQSAAQVNGTQSNEPVTPAQRLWADQRARSDQMAGNVNPETHAIVRQPDGTLAVKARTDGGTSTTPQPNGQQQAQGLAGEPTVANGQLVLGDLTLSPEQAKELLASKAAKDSRAALMPSDPSGYSTALPADFVLPPNVKEWAWGNDPSTVAALNSVKDFAHKNQLDQSAVSQLLAISANHQLAEMARFNAARQGEMNKLGSSANARIDSVQTWLGAMLGTEVAKPLAGNLWSAPMVVAFESLMRHFVSQGVSANVGAGRDPGGHRPGRVDQATYDRMTYHEKLTYASQFQQPGDGR